MPVYTNNGNAVNCNTNSMININLTRTATVNGSVPSAVKWLWEAQTVYCYCIAIVNLSCKIAMTAWLGFVQFGGQIATANCWLKLSQWRVNLTFHCNSVYKLACLSRWHLAGKWHPPPASFRDLSDVIVTFFTPTQILNMNIYKLSL